MTLIKVRDDGMENQFVLLDEDALEIGDDDVYLVTVSNSGHDVSIESVAFRPLPVAHA